jgi:hypothetical protein
MVPATGRRERRLKWVRLVKLGLPFHPCPSVSTRKCIKNDRDHAQWVRLVVFPLERGLESARGDEGGKGRWVRFAFFGSVSLCASVALLSASWGVKKTFGRIYPDLVGSRPRPPHGRGRSDGLRRFRRLPRRTGQLDCFRLNPKPASRAGFCSRSIEMVLCAIRSNYQILQRLSS